MNRYGFQEALEQLHSRYLSIRAELDAISYPFSHMDGEISCAGYAAPAAPTLEEPGAVIESTQQLLDLLRPLYQKTLARLVEIAERAEDAIGLKCLEAPTIEEFGEEEDENQQEVKA